MPETMLMPIYRGFATALLAALICGNALALDAAPDTLDAIKQTGRIVLGTQDTTIPLSYNDAEGRAVGYHMDVCMRIVKAIQQRLDMPAIKVVNVLSTIATRFALLNNNSIDIECSHNLVRNSVLSQALLSHATLWSDVRLMTTVDNPGLSLATLGGKTIGVAAGGSAPLALRTIARRLGVKINEVAGRQAGDIFELLESGRVNAIALPSPYAMAQSARSATPTRYVLLDEVLTNEPVSLMFRLTDERLQALSNEVIAALMKTGEMARLYDKWFVQPIPGVPRGLGIPLSPKLRALFDAPGSEMLAL